MDERKVVKTIAWAMPSVVSIIISKHLEDVEKEMGYKVHGFSDIKRNKERQDIPEEYIDAHGMVQVGGGSGFLVSADGLILTNKHVVAEKDAQYSVLLSDGTKHAATILTRDPINDIAILKVEASGLPFLTLGDSGHLELGKSVLAIGNALGIFRNTVSLGIISGLSRTVSASEDKKMPKQELRGLIQTDAAINPGNSGGPLVDLDGKVIGINVAVVSGAHSIGLAIPVNAAKRDLSDLKEFGRIRRPYLGVRYVTIDQNLAEKLRIPVSYGALVTKEGPKDYGVIPGSPAEKAGIRDGDIILEADGRKITTDATLQDHLETAAVGGMMTLTILRGGEKIEASLELVERK